MAGPLRSFVLPLALGACLWAAGALGQSLSEPRAEVVIVDPNRLFAETLFGQHISEALEAEAAELSANNRRLEDELRAEEKELTEKRPTMTAIDFRDAAEAFDKKVQAIRRERQDRARALEDRRTTAEQRFLATAQGVLVDLMNERGASILLDMRSIILRDAAIDITNDAVRKIDEAIGRGETLGTVGAETKEE
ncbi:OmpH family outer membrane protein [uncultured Lentibacter sp.]|uniref:OmpH family outer membrane protein n=1 Tax=uncultured Lentibacter sp. TaxID=1659309 RepID=UPI0026077A0F|nr:OmpH family outer membrane protein [uncultured Lentibacter sp.]MCW1956671.1 OmpH family outer membrane protein [Roseobacter sp.]